MAGLAGNGAPHLDAERAPLGGRHPGHQTHQRHGGRKHSFPGEAAGATAQSFLQPGDLGSLSPDQKQPPLAARAPVWATPAVEAEVLRPAGPPAVRPAPPLRGQAGLHRRCRVTGGPIGRGCGRRHQDLHQLHLYVRGGPWDGDEIMGERAGEREQLVRLGSRGDADDFHLTGEQPPLQGQVVGDDVPLDAGLDLQRLGLDRGSRGRQREILRRIGPGVDAQQRDQVTEPLDERRLSVHAVASVWGGGLLPKLHGGSARRNPMVGGMSDR